MSEPTHEQAAERAELLRKEIERAMDAYYVRDDPVMSDAAYDDLFDELKAIEEKFPDLLTPDSPTQRVGAAAVSTDLRPVVHPEPMLSLGKANAREEVEEWLARANRILDRAAGEPIACVCEPKIDGLSVELIYRDGALETGSTRGDGFTGEDITPNLRALPQVPARLPAGAPPLLIVRGEVYFPIEAFQKLNKRLE